MAGSLIQRRLSKAGLAKQTAKGSAAGAATWGYGTAGGSIFKLDLTENEIPLTWSNRDILGYDRSGVKPSQSLETVATPSLTGLLLLGVLGADVATPGTSTTLSATAAAGATQISTAATIPAGSSVQIGTGATAEQHTTGTPSGAGPFTIPLTTPLANAQTSGAAVVTATSHVITPAAILPYLTAFGSFGTADWAQIVDSKVSSLELSWEEAGRVTAKPEILGCTPSFLAAAYTETNNEVLSTVGFFTAGGGTYLVGGQPVQCTGGSVKLDTHIDQPITAATVLPPDVVEGKLEITWSLKLLPTDTSFFRQVYFGSGAAGALSGITPFPDLTSLSVQFPGPGGQSLTIASPQCRAAVEFPESNPDGGPAELTLTGTSTLPSTGSSVTATLKNFVNGY